MTTQPGSTSPINLRGAVDLSGMKKAATQPASSSAPTGGAGSSWVVDVSEANLQSVVEQSLQVPVVFLLWSPQSDSCTQLAATMERLTRATNGKILLAKVNIQEDPRMAQAFNAQAVPMVLAIVKGQQVPLFQGPAPEEQVAELFNQLLQMAAQNGVTGTLPPETDQPAAANEPAPLPPLHAKAQAALQENDLETAAAAYAQAVKENPGDDDALRGVAQVSLMQRIAHADMDAVRHAAAQNPIDPEAVMAVTDLDIVGGHVEDGFARLIECIKITHGDQKNVMRERIVELFTLIGHDDPRVVAARRALASALF